jgi:hypothetical protein
MKGKRSAKLTLTLGWLENRAPLPVIELQRAA